MEWIELNSFNVYEIPAAFNIDPSCFIYSSGKCCSLMLSGEESTISLTGHSASISALCLISLPRRVLATVASDYLIAWDIEKCIENNASGRHVRGVVVSQIKSEDTDLGPQCVDINIDGTLIAVGNGCDILLYSSQDRALVYVLSGHGGFISCINFLKYPNSQSFLVSSSYDRSFRIWNVNSGEVVFNSGIISGGPLVSLAVDEPVSSSRFSVVSSSGFLFVYDARPERSSSNAPICSRLRRLDLSRLLRRDSNPNPELSNQQNDQSLPSFLSLRFVNNSSPDALGQSSALPDSQSYLLIGLSSAIIVLDGRTFSMLCLLDFNEYYGAEVQVESLCFGGGSNSVGSATAAVYLSTGVFSLLTLNDKRQSPTSGQSGSSESLTDCSSESSETPILSVIAREPLLQHSLLRRVLQRKKPAGSGQHSRGPLSFDAALTSTTAGARNSKRNTAPADLPLTFHAKVRSSGYGNAGAARREMFKPQINSRKTLSERLQQAPSPKEPSAVCEQIYPKESAPPSELIASSRPLGESAPLLGVSMCPQGKLIGCAFANKLALIVRSAAAFGSTQTTSASGPLVLRGHEGAVTQIAFSASRQWALSSSADCTAALWNVTDGALALRVDRVLRNRDQNPTALTSAGSTRGSTAVAAAAAAASQKRSVLQGGSNKPSKWSNTGSAGAASDLQRFSDAVRFAQFFYLDEFFLLASGNSFYLYKYLVDLSKSDIQRYISNCNYKLVKKFALDCQQVTALNAVNSFYSYLVLVGSSARSVGVYDLNAGLVASELRDAHSTAPHCLRFNQGSMFSSLGSEQLNLFLSAAKGDGIFIWDLRTQRHVQLLSGHPDRGYQAMAAFSPCGRFVATGASDNSAYTYDIRQSGTFLNRLSAPHSDTVADCAWNPRSPTLCTATLSGQLSAFGPV